ncbi:YD repeat protein [Candidatus Rickettsiella viridis]|uniref:YD repeat protein n=1 Tax=Candidatus Rickettsiella viridis TaxID=676208 RepID=A0A2Z5UUP6_9COXI|nr:anthrax toxin-like adenylyl cyclase domain-containing protein [Candidatus Rickettsiella viridis]BBB15279.1 YD repeat protein [Candidatus Rickettsiella viridis]
MSKKLTFFNCNDTNEPFKYLTYEEIIQKFVDETGLIIAIRAVKPQALQIDEGYERYDRGYDSLDGGSANFQPLPFEQGIQRTVDDNKVIVAVRPVNPMAFQLIEEGYDTKTLFLKAKSSSAGITAGFIMQEPLFGKGGKKDAKEQAKRIQKSLASGCELVQLNVTTGRVNMLETQGFISIKEELEQNDIKIKRIESIYDGDAHCFVLKQNQEDLNFWEVWYDNKPLMALANPGGAGIKAAVTADYDLFGIYTHKNQSVVNRPMVIHAQIKAGASQSVTQRWQQCVDSMRRSDGATTMDPAKGNISIPELKIVEQLNKTLKKAGYTGEALVWHGTETANPYTPGPDFPIRVYSPGQTQPAMVSDQKELADFYHRLQDSPYHAEENAAFRMKAF